MANITLQQFLISLRYQTDQASQNNMLAGIGKVAGAIFALDKIWSGLKTAAKFGDQWVENTAKAEIAIRSLGIKSLSHFKSMQDAAERVGISAEEMTSSFETLKQMRFDFGPSANNLFKLMNGKISSKDDIATVLEKMGAGAAQMAKAGISTPEISARAQAAGMSTRMARIMAEQGPEWQRELAQFKKDNAGLDSQAPQTAAEIAAQKAHVQAQLFGKLAGSGAAESMTEEYKKGTDALKAELEKAGDTEVLGLVVAQEVLGVNLEMAATMANMAAEFGKQIDEHLGSPFGSMKDSLQNIAKDMHILAHPIDSTVAAVGRTTEAGLDWVKDNMGLIAGVGAAKMASSAILTNKAKDILQATTGIGAGGKAGTIESYMSKSYSDLQHMLKVKMMAASKGIDVSGTLDTLKGEIARRDALLTVSKAVRFIAKGSELFAIYEGASLASDLQDAMLPPSTLAKREAQRAGMANAAGGMYQEAKGFMYSRGMRSKVQDDIMRTLMMKGISRDDAADMLASFQAESGLNPYVTGDSGKARGLGGWHPDRQMNYTKLYGHTMQSVTNVAQAIDEQTRFAVWETQNSEKDAWRRMHTEKYSGSGYSRFIERPGLTDEAKDREAMARAAGAENIKQHNTINVTVPAGTQDPYAFGKEVGKGINDATNAARYKMQYAG